MKVITRAQKLVAIFFSLVVVLCLSTTLMTTAAAETGSQEVNNEETTKFDSDQINDVKDEEVVNINEDETPLDDGVVQVIEESAEVIQAKQVELEEKARKEREAAKAAEAKKQRDAEVAKQNEAPTQEVVKKSSPSGNNQSMSLEEFVAEWAPRIDRYLSGSRLAGQGKTFATAAWKYNVDPRVSPAISCIESSKGAKCFRPYNAWGWGNMGFSSWEEAIDTHVCGYSNGYGYGVTRNGASKYCPPNAGYWYSGVTSEMSRI